MTELRKTNALVKALLEADERCRNSDSYLYLKVLSVVAERNGINLKDVTIPYFLLNLHGSAFPLFETVRRARQKVQEQNPELSACEIVAEYRAENEAAYRAFARGEL